MSTPSSSSYDAAASHRSYSEGEVGQRRFLPPIDSFAFPKERSRLKVQGVGGCEDEDF